MKCRGIQRYESNQRDGAAKMRKVKVDEKYQEQEKEE